MDAADVVRFRGIGDIACSPDGSRVAYTVRSIDPEADEYRSVVWLVDATGGGAIELAPGTGDRSAPRWSPDGRSIAFLAKRPNEEPQLCVVNLDAGEPRRLTDLPYGAMASSWSPDGTRLLFRARVPDLPRPTEPRARKRWEDRPRHVTRAQYKADGEGYIFDRPTHLFVADIASSRITQITDGDAEDHAESWSPDGRCIAWSRTRTGATDYEQADIYVANADGSGARQLTARVARPTSPTWSPDGTQLAFHAGDEPTFSYGDPMVRVWVVPADGSARERPITKDFDYAVRPLLPPAATPGPVWSPDGKSVTSVFSIRGDSHVVRVALDGTTTTVVGGERQIAYLSAIPGKRLAFAAGDVRDPSEAYVTDWGGGNERRITRLNDDLIAELRPPIERRRVFDTAHGKIEGWLMTPSSPKAPLLVEIHGGPHSFRGDVFGLGYFFKYVLASKGWVVLSLNPTGSGTYGRTHAHGIRGRWGEYDLPEQLAAVDTLIEEGVVDPDRLAVVGYSYGGFMTSWTIGHSDRFRAAVVGAPVVDHESFHGTSDIGLWFAPFELNLEYPAGRETLRKYSPLTYVDKITTPTLIVHGEADDRCPIGQGEQLFGALLACGKAETEFARYPGGSHMFIENGRPSHRIDYNRRIVDWVTRHTT